MSQQTLLNTLLDQAEMLTIAEQMELIAHLVQRLQTQLPFEKKQR